MAIFVKFIANPKWVGFQNIKMINSPEKKINLLLFNFNIREKQVYLWESHVVGHITVFLL